MSFNPEGRPQLPELHNLQYMRLFISIFFKVTLSKVTLNKKIYNPPTCSTYIGVLCHMQVRHWKLFPSDTTQHGQQATLQIEVKSSIISADVSFHLKCVSCYLHVISEVVVCLTAAGAVCVSLLFITVAGQLFRRRLRFTCTSMHIWLFWLCKQKRWIGLKLTNRECVWFDVTLYTE